MNDIVRRIALGTGALALALALPLSAQTTQTYGGSNSQNTNHPNAKADQQAASKSSTSQLSQADQHFLDKVAQDDKAEIEVAKLAQDKTQDPNLKSAAQKMQDDHTKNLQEVSDLASKKGVTLPDDVDAHHKAIKDRLEKLSGSQFDQAFLRSQARDHHHDIREFEREANTTKDQDVKSFAQNTLPTLQEHMKLVQQDMQKEGMSTQATNNPQQQQPK